ncbi:uncharacterized protein LOC124360104 [Homalodisca vitripennis]|uniref:uncharacterized protein LOC124360104 n=1 Tax=Homalodisca vitripennis TaxID=197043 RepID=UPI001EEA6FCB|nr:uncharacterized protein LOC124360104 [Homalodisca vitripennis]
METRSLWGEFDWQDYSWRSRRRRDCCSCSSEYLRSRSYFTTTVIIDRSSMAPGTSSMLRARRRDVNVKPNRVLDRNSSRGMIYENEELRLRTININAEVEKGHSDIKKLRLENDRLRREIWNLRDEYDRLEALYKAKQLSMDTEEEELESEDQEAEGEGEPQPEDRDETAEDNMANQRKDGDVLSVVEEEPEDLSDNGEDHRQRTVSFKDDNLTVPGKSQQSEDVETLPCWPDDSYIPGPQIPVPRNPFPGLETLLRNVTAEQQDQECTHHIPVYTNTRANSRTFVSSIVSILHLPGVGVAEYDQYQWACLTSPDRNVHIIYLCIQTQEPTPALSSAQSSLSYTCLEWE